MPLLPQFASISLRATLRGMKAPLRTLLLSLLVALAVSGCTADSPSPPVSDDDDDDSVGDDDDSEDSFELWVQVGCNLHVSTSCAEAISVMERAALAGYTGVHFVPFKDHLIRTGEAIEADFENVSAVLSRAEQLGLDVMKDLGALGVGEGLLRSNPNLAEGIPATASYRVSSSGQTMQPASPESVVLNGDFEEWNGANLSGWDWTDAGMSQDSTVKYQGGSSLHIDFSANAAENIRAGLQVSVEPFQQYVVSFRAKSEGVSLAANQFGVHVKESSLGGYSWRVWLSATDFVIEDGQDWTRYQFTFNSLAELDSEGDGLKDLVVYLGAWGVTGVDSGDLWLDDLSIVRTGLVNLIRREGAPLTAVLVDENSTTALMEGEDFGYIEDPLMGRSGGLPGTYDRWHEPPVITIPASSVLQVNQKVDVSYFAVERVDGYSVAPSLCSDELLQVVDGHVEMLQTFYPSANHFLFGYDEIRQANWGADCDALGLSPGALLARHLQESVLRLHAQVESPRIYTWSDMLDPTHNAVDGYYLANGSFAESWVDLPSDLVIVNWRADSDSFQHFEGLGLRQLVSGDGSNIVERLAAAEGVSGIVGAHFVDWGSDYTALEWFASTVLGQR